MKTTSHLTTNRRQPSDPRASHRGSSFPHAEHHYQSDTLTGSCGTPARFERGPSFFRISEEYFAEEANRGFLVDTGVFAALILTVLFPIANGLQAVATLVHSISVL